MVPPITLSTASQTNMPERDTKSYYELERVHSMKVPRKKVYCMPTWGTAFKQAWESLLKKAITIPWECLCLGSFHRITQV